MQRLVQRILPSVQARVAIALLRRRKQARGRSLKEASEDLVQDVFATLFARQGQVLRSWSPERGLALRGFVGLVAERQVGMTLRSGRRSPFTEDATECEQLQRQAAAAVPSSMHACQGGAALESRDLLRVMLQRLRERLSEQGYFIFELLFVEECTIEQVTELTGLSRDALYAWRSRIARQAREIHEQLLENPKFAANTQRLPMTELSNIGHARPALERSEQHDP